MPVRIALVLLANASLLVPESLARAQTDTHDHYVPRHHELTGLYEADGDYVAVGLIPAADIIYFARMSTGDMRFMTPMETGGFYFSPTRNATSEVDGVLRFRGERSGLAQSLIWIRTDRSRTTFQRVASSRAPVRFPGADGATLFGWLIRPAGTEPCPAVVLVPQSDRYDLWEVGMWLLSRGLAVLAYDQRNSDPGMSSGPAVSGRYQDRQAVHARDATAAVGFLREQPDIDPDRIGIAGWSGGGFTAAFVAGEDERLGFYVNIAGDASPGFEQATHLFTARLMREGYPDEDVEAARAFVADHFGVATGDVSWKAYQMRIAEVSETGWYGYLATHYSIPYTREEGITEIGDYQAEWPPERVYGAIRSTPTLGIFFEFDHSSSPSSPMHFQHALHLAGNGDYAVAVIPDTNHAGFVLNGQRYRFDTSTLTRRSPGFIDLLADWAERHVRR